MADEAEWKPPTEREFNQDWLMPIAAINLINPAYQDQSTTKRWIMARLKTGVIQAVARTTEIQGKRYEFNAVPQRLWNQCDDWGEDHFWQTGDEIFYHGETRVRSLDIRFDPNTIASRALKPSPPEMDPTPATPPKPKEKSGPNKRDNLSPSDAERFCKFLLEVRPNATERDAHKRAVNFFHDRKVPRDWFWDIFRTIRGHRNPGKQPKDRI
jgi:hypothetical protein